MKFIGCFNKSVILTYVGLTFSILGIYNLLLTSELYSVNRVDIAVICLILAGICDLFDGVIARKCKRNETQKKFGVQIDSLIDVISFLIFPSILLFYIWNNKTILYLLVIVFYILCGITRLAWFNIKVEDFKDKYQGLPVTYSALIIPIVYAIFQGNSLLKIIMPIIYCILGLLFILDMKINKPKGIWYIVFAVLAIIVSLLIIF